MGEIQGNSNTAEWRHINGDLNVADDISRGVAVSELNGRWEHGPAFLQLPENQWPAEVLNFFSVNQDTLQVEEKLFTSIRVEQGFAEGKIF